MRSVSAPTRPAVYMYVGVCVYIYVHDDAALRKGLCVYFASGVADCSFAISRSGKSRFAGCNKKEQQRLLLLLLRVISQDRVDEAFRYFWTPPHLR